MMLLRWHDPGPSFDRAPQRPDPWRVLFSIAAAGVVVATLWPWCGVGSERVFGRYYGPVGWQTDAGLTCLCGGLLAAMLGTLECELPANRASTRDAAVLLAGSIAAVLGIAWWNGPGWLRGVPAGWTLAFLGASAAAVALGTAAGVRFAMARRRSAPRLDLRSERPPHNSSPHNSSGPPT